MLLCAFETDVIPLKPPQDAISERVSFALKGSEIQGRRHR